jgi:hypothetical protein
MHVLFEQSLDEVRREWRSLSFRQRRLVSLVVGVGLSGCLWLGIVVLIKLL